MLVSRNNIRTLDGSIVVFLFNSDKNSMKLNSLQVPVVINDVEMTATFLPKALNAVQRY